VVDSHMDHVARTLVGNDGVYEKFVEKLESGLEHAAQKMAKSGNMKPKPKPGFYRFNSLFF